MTLQHCDWRTLATRVRAELGRVESVITDPPFSERVSAGARYGKRRDAARGVSTRGLAYASWSEAEALAFALAWGALCSRWMVVLCSHDQIGIYERAARELGRYCFPPIPCIVRGANVRLQGDGPSSWACYVVPSRPHGMNPRSGTLDGGYTGSRERLLVGGAKPLWLMRALVRDYSRAGDIVCDPCAGSGTTLLAARLEGRAYLGGELDAERHALARRRIDARG